MSESFDPDRSPSPGAMPAADAATAPEAQAAPQATAVTGTLEERAVEVLNTIFDPEIPVNIYELGLIYDLTFDSENNLKIKMTLTSPACPVAGSLPGEVQTKVQAVPGMGEVEVELVWDPAWNPTMMTEAAKLQLGMM